MEKETIKQVMSELGRRSWAVRKARHGKDVNELLSKAGKASGKAKRKRARIDKKKKI